MKKLASRQKILLGCVSMLLAIIGDFLLGFGMFGMSSDADAFMGITANKMCLGSYDRHASE